jgi:hypothetical protein
MATKRAQTMAKRAREQALKERRERKQAKKAESAAQRAAARDGTAVVNGDGVAPPDVAGVPDDDPRPESHLSG